MLLNPHDLIHQPERLEEIERTSLRLVVQALYDYRFNAEQIFRIESDLVADIGEDITREAIDKMGLPRIDRQLFGKIDYKRACYLFHPDYAIKQALFVDSKAEKVSGQGTATLQISQISMTVRQIRSGRIVMEQGCLPFVATLDHEAYITTTIFVKYNYIAIADAPNRLNSITVAAVPNGMLQATYNPHENDTIFVAGRNAPTLGEEFRVRLSFARLKDKARWRVQMIPMAPHPFVWDG